MKRVLIVSGKGGVGRTSLTANLIYALGRTGSSVMAADLDMTTPALDLALGEEVTAGWRDLLEKKAEFDSVAISLDSTKTVLPFKGCGPHAPEYSVMQTQALLELLAKGEHEADWLLLDTPAGPAPEVLKAAAMVDLVLFVLTPEPASLAASFVLARSIESDAAWGVIVNQADSKSHAQEVWRRFDKVCSQFLSRRAPLAGFVRRDERAMAASREMRIWSAVDPPAACVRDLRLLAGQLDELIPQAEEIAEEPLAVAA